MTAIGTRWLKRRADAKRAKPMLAARSVPAPHAASTRAHLCPRLMEGGCRESMGATLPKVVRPHRSSQARNLSSRDFRCLTLETRHYREGTPAGSPRAHPSAEGPAMIALRPNPTDLRAGLSRTEVAPGRPRRHRPSRLRRPDGSWRRARRDSPALRPSEVLHLHLPLRRPEPHRHLGHEAQRPDAIRGEFKPIATNVPGIEITEHLPRLAKLADTYSIVRVDDPRRRRRTARPVTR